MLSLKHYSGSVLSWRCQIGKRAMWLSQLEEAQHCVPESHRKNTVLWNFGHLLQRLTHLRIFRSHLAQRLFSNSQYIIATDHQCVCSCSVSVLTWPNGSSPGILLQCWHCQGLFILLLLNLSSKTFHCLCIQVLQGEHISHFWYQNENKKCL